MISRNYNMHPTASLESSAETPWSVTRWGYRMYEWNVVRKGNNSISDRLNGDPYADQRDLDPLGGPPWCPYVFLLCQDLPGDHSPRGNVLFAKLWSALLFWHQVHASIAWFLMCSNGRLESFFCFLPSYQMSVAPSVHCCCLTCVHFSGRERPLLLRWGRPAAHCGLSSTTLLLEGHPQPVVQWTGRSYSEQKYECEKFLLCWLHHEFQPPHTYNCSVIHLLCLLFCICRMLTSCLEVISSKNMLITMWWKGVETTLVVVLVVKFLKS